MFRSRSKSDDASYHRHAPLSVEPLESRTLLSSESPVGAVLFEDDFNDGDLADWEVITGSWAVESGELSGTGEGGGVDAWIHAGDESWTDYVFETKVVFGTGNAELVFRSTGHWENEYRVSLWSEDSPSYTNRFQLGRYNDGVSYTCLTADVPGSVHCNAPSPVPITNPTHVRIEAIGSSIRLILNDQLVFETEDPAPLPNGRIGLGVIWSWHGHFDDVVVSDTSPPEINVAIDIKPGSDPNSINLKSNGVIPVAILTTSIANGDPVDFDATSVDTSTIEFGDTRDGFARVNPVRTAVEDVDGDGDLDLIVHFSMRDIKKLGALDADSVDAILGAETLDGTEIFGIDSVRIVPKKK